MRFLFYFILMMFAAYGAEVDRGFFAIESKKVFIEDAKQKIAQNGDGNLTELESVLLEKIEQLDSKKIVIAFEKKVFDNNKSMRVSDFRQLITELIEAQKELLLSQNKIADIALKLDYTKKEIEAIVSEAKKKELSYQLQYTLYQLVINREKAKSRLYEEYIAYMNEQLPKLLPKLDTQPYQKLLSEFNAIKATIESLEDKKVALDTKIERESLVEEGNASDKMTKKQTKIENKVQKEYLALLKMSFDLSLMEIALDKQVIFYKSLKNAKSYFELIDPNKIEDEKLYHTVLKELAKTHFGLSSMVVSASQANFSESMSYLWNLLFKPLFVFNEKAITSANILKILTIIVIGFTVASFYRRRLLRWSSRWVRATPMSARLSANIGYYFLVFITIIVALSSIGLDLSSFSMFASALAIGIGFGLQTVVSNMVAGIIMMFERSIRIGDLIEVNETLIGFVTDMKIRSTVIKTFDNIDVVVPNSTFIQSNVINLTLDDTTRRLHIPFGVAYGTQVDKVKEVILTELAHSNIQYYEDKDKKALIRMRAMGASSVDYELLVWVDVRRKPPVLESDFLILIYNALYKHKIEIPFPQLDVHMKRSSDKRGE
jgi:small-conductance mechanosensitive channel